MHILVCKKVRRTLLDQSKEDPAMPAFHITVANQVHWKATNAKHEHSSLPPLLPPPSSKEVTGVHLIYSC